MRRRRLSLGLAGLLVLVAIWEIAWTRHAESSVPDDTAWHAAATYVRANYHPGDLIVFAPAWNDPVGRLHLGDLIPLAMAGRMDAAKYGRIWELAIRDAHSPDTAGLSPVATTQIAGITVRRFERAPAVVLYDLLDHAAETTVVNTGPPSLQLQEVGFAPRRCLLIRPAPNRPAQITFPALPAGQLVGYVGLADVFTRRKIRSPARLDIQIDSHTVATATATIDNGWTRFAAPHATTGPVTVVISATESERLVCFAAEVRQ